MLVIMIMAMENDIDDDSDEDYDDVILQTCFFFLYNFAWCRARLFVRDKFIS